LAADIRFPYYIVRFKRARTLATLAVEPGFHTT